MSPTKGSEVDTTIEQEMGFEDQPVGGESPDWYFLPMFRGVPRGVLDELARVMEPLEFDAETEIISQGERGDYMYVITSGQVRIQAASTMHDTMFELIMRAPGVVGEMALLTDEPRTATVVAESGVQCLRGSKAHLDQLIAAHPRAAQILTTLVGRRLIEARTISAVGKYTVVGRLGRGAMATVFEAKQPNLDRNVALKMLSHARVNQPGFAEYFQREARLIAGLDHPNIVRVIDTVEGYGTHFIVMEKLTGNALDELIRERVRLDWDSVRRVLRQICLALHYSHEKGLLHRDIKPSNAFLAADGSVKLLDFGVALEAKGQTPDGRRHAGTPYYMAPEQILGKKLDGRADLYSTGILAYQLVTHRVPFDATTVDFLWKQHLRKTTPDPRDIFPDTPDDVCAFIEKATRKRPEDRFESCLEAADFLLEASELPLVGRFDVANIVLQYHHSRAERVWTVIDELARSLADLDGIRLHVSSTEEDEL